MRTNSLQAARRLFLLRQRLNDPAPASDAAGILDTEDYPIHQLLMRTYARVFENKTEAGRGWYSTGWTSPVPSGWQRDLH